MPYRREWVPPTCLRCEREIEGTPRRGRRKFCDDCRPIAHVGYHMRLLLQHLQEMPGSPELDEVAVAVSEMRERLNIGEDLFPLDGQGMSVAEYAQRSGLSRDAVRPFRGIGAR